LFCAGTEQEIIELIFRLLGSPKESLLDSYKSYPDWEKMNFTKQYPSQLNNQFGRHFDHIGIALLDRLLDLDPSTRITAKDALQHLYFAPEKMVEPER
jgi:serine/threonine protein kinase